MFGKRNKTGNNTFRLHCIYLIRSDGSGGGGGGVVTCCVLFIKYASNDFEKRNV